MMRRAEAAAKVKENVEMLLAFTLERRKALRDFVAAALDGERRAAGGEAGCAVAEAELTEYQTVGVAPPVLRS